MKTQKYYLSLDNFERRLIVNCLTEWRNTLLRDGRCTEDVDALLLKIIDAKMKRKLFHKGA